MQVKAEDRNIRMTARKARLVIDLVRGKKPNDALNILKIANKKASPIISKVIKSAVANAVNNNKMKEDNLYISQAYVNAGALIKRMMPRARGRADVIHKKLSHVTIFVSERSA